MKYKHVVKYNGEYYPAGAEVPVEGKVEKKAEEPKKPSALLDDEEEAVPKKRPGRPPKDKE